MTLLPVDINLIRDQICGQLVEWKRGLFGGVQMHEPPRIRMRVGLTPHPFRILQPRSYVSTLLGRLTSAVGYQPTLATEMGSFQGRITSTKNGSITSIQAVYVPANDMTDPAPATTFIHLDATTVLARSLAAKGDLSNC